MKALSFPHSKLICRPLQPLLFVYFVGLANCQTTAFDVNDLSFLWPVPNTPDDVARFISMDHSCSDGSIWPDDLFKQVIDIAVSREIEASINGSTRKFSITFEEDLKKVRTWKLAGIRVNQASAGTSLNALEKVGQIPGIRLVAQPVTVEAGKVVVHDHAAHVVFNLLKAESQGRLRPPFLRDDSALGEIAVQQRT